MSPIRVYDLQEHLANVSRCLRRAIVYDRFHNTEVKRVKSHGRKEVKNPTAEKFAFGEFTVFLPPVILAGIQP